MASISKTVEIIFGANAVNLDSTLNDLSTSFGRFDGAVQGIADPVAGFTKKLLATEAAIAATGAALVGFAINEAGTFKGSINEIGALFNATSEQSKTLGDDILNFAATSVFSIDDINQATFTAISTGTEWTEVTGQLATAQKLAVAGSTNLGDATAALSRTMNAYGFDASEATRVSEALFVAAQQGDTNLTELGNAFGALSSTAAASGVSLESALAAVSAITVAGVGTSESMTLLKSLFRELASPSDALSVALGGITLESDGLQKTMEALQVATGGSQAKMDALFGSSEAVAGALILSKDASGAFATSLEAMANKTGTVTAAFKLMENDLAKINQNIANSFNVVLIKAGKNLLDEYGGIGGAISSIFQSIGTSIDEGQLKQLTGAVEAFLSEVDIALNGVAKALPSALEKIDFSGLLGAFGELGDEFGAVFDNIFGADLDLSKPEDLAEALQTGVNILESFVGITRGIVKQFQPIFSAIGEAAKRIGETSTETDKATGEFLGALTLLSQFDTKLGAVIIILGESKAEISNVFDTIGGGAKIFINSLQSAFDLLVQVVANSLAEIAEIADTLTFGKIDGLGEAAADLRLLGDAAGANLKRNLAEAGEGFTQLGQGIGTVKRPAEEAKKGLEGTGDATKTFISSIEGGQKALDAIVASHKKYKGSLEKTGEATKDLSDKEKESLKEKNELEEWHKQFPNVVEGTVKAIKKTASATDELTERQKLAVIQSNNLALQLNELASNEKIASMEFTADIKVAQFESQAKQVVAQLEAMAEGLESNNELVGTLFGTDAPDWDNFGFGIREAAKDANDRANVLNEGIIKKNEAQLKLFKEQSKSLAKGGAKINIEANNLAPELQAVLESLIDNIRVQANQQGLEMLL
jgi:TP901 family phage tail tape measure protein